MTVQVLRLSIVLMSLLLASGIASATSRPPPPETRHPHSRPQSPLESQFCEDQRHYGGGTDLCRAIRSGRYSHVRTVQGKGGSASFYLAVSSGTDGQHGLYDRNGSYVCSPSGGYGGRGRRNCPSWVEGLDL